MKDISMNSVSSTNPGQQPGIVKSPPSAMMASGPKKARPILKAELKPRSIAGGLAQVSDHGFSPPTRQVDKTTRVTRSVSLAS